MKSMIESLESRQMFSAASAAVVALRKDLTALSQPLPVILRAYGTFAEQINASLSAFGIVATDSDGSLVQTLHLTFDANLHQLGRDITIAKSLINQDIVRMVLAEHLVTLHPSNEIYADLVINDASILTAQAQNTAAAVQEDADLLTGEYEVNAAAIVVAHPIDATLSAETDTLDNVFAITGSQIEATSIRIVDITAPSFIDALESSEQINAA